MATAHQLIIASSAVGLGPSDRAGKVWVYVPRFVYLQGGAFVGYENFAGIHVAVDANATTIKAGLEAKCRALAGLPVDAPVKWLEV